MKDEFRYSDTFWREAYLAALTGLTMMGGVQVASGRDSNGPAPVVDLATTDAATAPEPLAADVPDHDDPLAAVAPYHAALVREAAAIADATIALRSSTTVRKGRASSVHNDGPSYESGRVPVNQIGNVPREGTR